MYRSSNVLTPSTNPPISSLTGGQLAKEDRLMSAYAGASYMIGNGARVVGRMGMQGALDFQVQGFDPDTEYQEYPNNTDSRVVMRLKWDRTPGALVILAGLVLPCGMTQKYVDEPGSWIGDIVDGAVIVNSTFTGPGGVETTYKIIDNLPLSTEPNGALPAGTAACWKKMEFIDAILDDFQFATPAVQHDWSENVTAEVTVMFRGGVRMVDLAILEVPATGYVRDIGSDANSTYYLPMVTNGSGQVVKAYPRDYPVTRFTGSDPTYGSLLLADVNHRQHNLPGPILAQWGSWSDEYTEVDQLDVGSITITSSTFTSIPISGYSGWRADQPGWSVSSGGNAQQYKSSNSKRILRDLNACVPVKFWVYAKRDGTTDATIRFVTEDYSVAELKLSNSSYEWLSTTGHIRCGLGAEDDSVLMAFGKTGIGLGSSLSIQHMVVQYKDL